MEDQDIKKAEEEKEEELKVADSFAKGATLKKKKPLNKDKRDFSNVEIEKPKEEKKKKPLPDKIVERILFLCFSVLVIIIEALPKGVKIFFASPLFHENVKVVESSYSYFSLMPLKYGIYFPFIAAVFSCGFLYYIIKLMLTDKAKAGKTAKNFAVFGFVFSFLHLIDFRSINVYSVIISIILFFLTFVYRSCVSDSQKYKEIKISDKGDKKEKGKSKGEKTKKEKKEKKPKKEKKKKK